MSKNTTHCWKVVDMGNYYRLYHAHKYEDGYHLHGQYGLMITAVIFYVSTYIGIFLGTVSLIIQILEFPMRSKEIIKARQSPAEF